MISSILFYFGLAWMGALIFPATHSSSAEFFYWITFLLVGSVFWYRWFRKNRID